MTTPTPPITPPSSPTPATPTTPTVPVVRAGRSGNVLNLVLILAALIAIGGIAFAVGRTTAPRTTAATGAGAGNGTFGGPRGSGGPRASGGPGGFGGGFGGRAAGLRGTVTAVSPTSITIQVANAGTITIGIDGSTTYHREVAGGATDPTPGKEVIVQLNGRNPNGGTAGASPGPSGFGAGTATDITVVTP
ncbi:MAG: hypothetical protein M3067_09105 [Chloroflexota bacterium]|nr:hypothetical protein [Chloroflexota bacterium]